MKVVIVKIILLISTSVFGQGAIKGNKNGGRIGSAGNENSQKKMQCAINVNSTQDSRLLSNKLIIRRLVFVFLAKRRIKKPLRGFYLILI